MTTRNHHRLAAAACTALLAGGTALAAPTTAQGAPESREALSAAAAAGGATCPELLAQSHATREVGWLSSLSNGKSSFSAGERTKIPFVGTSSAWIAAPAIPDPEDGGAYYYAGYHLIINGKGSAALVRDVENGFLEGSLAVRGPWKGLRLIASAGATGTPENGKRRATYLYGITTAGRLVRMPVTWNAKSIPTVGAQQVIGSGFGQVVDLEFNSWEGKNWVPTKDYLVGITRTGAFAEWTITRGKKPTVRSKVLAKSGYKGLKGLHPDSCLSDDMSNRWGATRANGTIVNYVDPNYADHSLKGMKIQGKPFVTPKRVAAL